MSTTIEKGSHSIASSSSFVDIASCNNSPSSVDDLDDDDNEFKHNVDVNRRQLHRPHQQPHEHHHQQQQIRLSENDSVAASPSSSAMGGISVPNHGLSAAFHGYHAHNHNNNKSPFLLPAQLYKSLFANAVLQSPDKLCSHPFPRNLLFSYSEKSPNSDFDTDDKNSLGDEVCGLSYILSVYCWRNLYVIRGVGKGEGVHETANQSWKKLASLPSYAEWSGPINFHLYLVSISLKAILYLRILLHFSPLHFPVHLHI